jgi:ABC-type phosphate transport system substrate-binding protein
MTAMRSLLALLVCLAAGAAASEAFIAHPEVGGVTLTRAELGDILHGRRTTWPNGQRIVLIALDEDAGPVAASVLKEYARKSPAQFVAYWKRQVFTGKGALPRTARTAEEMLSLVAATPGALGFLDAAQVTGAVTVIPVR